MSKARGSNLGEEEQCTAMGGERGPRAYSAGLLVGLKMAKLLLKGRMDPGTLQGIIPGGQAGPTPGSQSLGPRLWFNLSTWQTASVLFITQGDFFAYELSALVWGKLVGWGNRNESPQICQCWEGQFSLTFTCAFLPPLLARFYCLFFFLSLYTEIPREPQRTHH